MESIRWTNIFGEENLLIEGESDNVFHVIPKRVDENGNSYTAILSKKAIIEFAEKSTRQDDKEMDCFSCTLSANAWKPVNHDIYGDPDIPEGFLLVMHGDGIIYEAELCKYDDSYGNYSVDWFDRDGEYVGSYYEITHWRPLPEPPEELPDD